VTVPTIQLSRGAAMPQIGLGTWPLNDAQAETAVAQALELGYRLFDTAENYRNERGVGAGIRASGVPREDVFITTKFNKAWHGRDLVGEALDGSCERLGTDYVDLLLMHWPNPAQDRYVDGWHGMLELFETGRVKAIGVSNFKPEHLQRLIDATGEAPDVNQIELNPLVTRTQPRDYNAEHGIVTEAWSPFGGGGAEVLRLPTVTGIASKHERTSGQVVLRWMLQLDVVSIPKSIRPERLQENLDVFDFELDESDMNELNSLDEGESAATDSDVYGH
jgi:2,5-diketo-D-gluconate reductase A